VEDTSRLACQIKLTEEMDGMAVTVAQEEGF
jgi:ferredoxin